MMTKQRIAKSMGWAVAIMCFAACGDAGAGGSGATSSGGGGAGGADIYCGDAFVDPDLGEECDDGNADDDDECLNGCTLPKCGDGVLRAGSEDCDDGNADDTDACVSGCVAAACGDGFLQAGVEDCDDNNTVDGDACSATCTAGVGCGNNMVEAGEECDDGNTDDFDACTSACTSAICGDGFAQSGTEECDDGNVTDDDACSNGCTVNIPDNFQCLGISASLTAGGDVTLGGNTVDSMPSYEGSCGGADAPEYVFAITTEDEGVLTLDMLAVNSDLDPVLYVRDECEGGTELACSDIGFAGGNESVTFQATAGTTYYVFADGYATSTGEFLLGATLLGGAAGDDCPGVNVPLGDFNETYTVSGNTDVATDDHTGTGDCDWDAKEIVYRVTPPNNGKLVVALAPSMNFDAALYIRTNCASAASQIACSDAIGAEELELITQPVSAGVTYYVFVDGFTDQSGPYSVDFTMIP